MNADADADIVIDDSLMPTKPLACGGLMCAPPGAKDLARAEEDGHVRLELAYRILVAELAIARYHLARVLPTNYDDDDLDGYLEAFNWLGLEDLEHLEAMREMTPRECRLP